MNLRGWTAQSTTAYGRTTPREASQRKEKKDSPAQIQSKWERFERQNATAAGIILRNPQQYPGLPQEWAKAFLAAHRPGDAGRGADRARTQRD